MISFNILEYFPVDINKEFYPLISMVVYAFSILNLLHGDFYIFLLLSLISQYIDIVAIDYFKRLSKNKQLVLRLYNFVKGYLILSIIYTKFNFSFRKIAFVYVPFSLLYYFSTIVHIYEILRKKKSDEKVYNFINKYLDVHHISFYRIVLYYMLYVIKNRT